MHIARDFRFIGFCLASILLWMAYEPFMQILPVYMKEGFGIPESGYGLIMTVNALMVVFFQFAVTRVTEKYRDAYVMAAGSFWTGLAAVGAILSNNVWLFLVSMVILTIGELIWAPTAITYVARIAPVDMRGRYMGIYGMVGGISYGIGPIASGLAYDNIAPVAVWYLTLGLATVGTLAFMALARLGASSARGGSVPSSADGSTV
jgi:MFS family permease